MIRYTNSLAGLSADNFQDFFVGWPNSSEAQTHFQILEKSDHIVLAIDDETAAVVGFITAITDRTLSAYIPLLDVLPAYQHEGIGKKLVNGMMKCLQDFYMVDLLCDSSLTSFYEQFGFVPATAMMKRNYENQSGCHQQVNHSAQRQPFQVLIFPYRKCLSSFEFLLLQRRGDCAWQGVSGGGENTESPLEAAARELFEETGFAPIKMNKLDSTATIPKTQYKDWEQCPSELYVVTEYSFGTLIEGEAVLSDEYSDYRWCEFDHASELLKYDSNRTALWELNARLTQFSN